MMSKSWVFGVVMMAMPICMYSNPSEDEEKYVVEFDLNYDGAKTIESTSVNKGCAIQMGDCRLPERHRSVSRRQNNLTRFAKISTDGMCLMPILI